MSSRVARARAFVGVCEVVFQPQLVEGQYGIRLVLADLWFHCGGPASLGGYSGGQSGPDGCSGGQSGLDGGCWVCAEEISTAFRVF